MTGFTALVLAGSRGGADPVAAYAGVPHKALIPLAGRTLLERVVDALARAGAGRIAVCASDEVVRASGALAVEWLPAADGPSRSVLDSLSVLGAPLLVTTADHALLEPAWIAQFLRDAPPGADVCALMGRREVVEAAAPGTRRTYLRLADGDWSGCNLFLLASPRAASAVAFWRSAEALRKRPWRLAALLGPRVLLAYATRRLSLRGGVDRLGRIAGVRAAVVVTEYGRAAIDVDKPQDLDLVRALAEETAAQGAGDRARFSPACAR